MLHFYWARLKCHLKSKEGMFWSYIFPIVLATCFHFALGNVGKVENIASIPLGYVSTREDSTLKTAMEETEWNGAPMFSLETIDLDSAKQKLEKKEIIGYLVEESSIEFLVNEEGMKQTIVRSFLDQYQQKAKLIETIISENGGAIEEGLFYRVMDSRNFTKGKESKGKVDGLLIYMFSLLAYTCIFAANYGLDEVTLVQADLSVQGARIAASPVNKYKLFITNLLAAYTVHMGSVFLLFLYMGMFLKVNFNGKLGYFILASVLGSILGVMIGAMVGAVVRASRGVKEAICLAISLVGGFLSGMMLADMNALVALYAPWVNKINPVGVLSNAFSSLVYYDSLEMYYQYLGIMLIMIVVFSFIAYRGLRRKNYGSI